MNQRPALKEKVGEWTLGFRYGLAQGRKEGRAMQGEVQWRKLFGVVVVASVIGCGIILAVAIGLSKL
jgi:hypothetical protein